MSVSQERGQKLILPITQMLNEMAPYTYATNAMQFEDAFKSAIEKIPRTNNYSANLMYKVKQTSLYSVEVWKLTVTGDFKTKMWTLDFIHTNANK